MKQRYLGGVVCLFLIALRYVPLQADDQTESAVPSLKVKRCDDFEVNGKGDAAAWKKTEWVPLQKRSGGVHDYSAQIKMLYSKSGVYILFDGTDRILTATMEEDFADLWNEDVYECFFWPDEKHPVYFEYEISPLGYELPILVPKLDGNFLGWRPWHYEGERKIKKAISVSGGEQKSRAEVTGWRAEVFIPYALLKPLQHVPPGSGDVWRANFYRVDHDGGNSTSWDWSRVGRSFHEIEKYGQIEFE